MSVSVGTVAPTVAEQVRAFLMYPTTRHPLPPSHPDPHSVWIQPGIIIHTLPLYHHSRKSTVTEYPEGPWVVTECLTHLTQRYSPAFKGETGNVSAS